MKISFLPKTKPGKASLILFLSGLAAGIASSVVSDVIDNRIEYPNPLNSPLLGTLLYLTFAAMICTAITGLIAVLKKKEHAITVYIVVFPGVVLSIFILLFLIANLFQFLIP